MVFAIWASNRLVGQVHRKLCPRLIEQLPHQRIDSRGREAHRQQPVLERIVEEDIAKTRRYDRANAEADQAEDRGRPPS
jgi:hypothetical protein